MYPEKCNSRINLSTPFYPFFPFSPLLFTPIGNQSHQLQFIQKKNAYIFSYFLLSYAKNRIVLIFFLHLHFSLHLIYSRNHTLHWLEIFLIHSYRYIVLHYVDIPQFIQPFSYNWAFGFFQYFEIATNAVMSNPMHMHFHVDGDLSSRQIPRSGIAGSKGK